MEVKKEEEAENDDANTADVPKNDVIVKKE